MNNFIFEKILISVLEHKMATHPNRSLVLEQRGRMVSLTCLPPGSNQSELFFYSIHPISVFPSSISSSKSIQIFQKLYIPFFLDLPNFTLQMTQKYILTSPTKYVYTR